MITIKNIPSGIGVIPGAGLRLTPGQKVAVLEPTKQIKGLVGE